MSIIITIVIGFVVGLIARALMPGNDTAGFIITTLLGIGGALVGQYLGQFMGLYREGEPAGFFMSILGALVLLFFYRVLNKRNAAP